MNFKYHTVDKPKSYWPSIELSGEYMAGIMDESSVLYTSNNSENEGLLTQIQQHFLFLLQRVP